MLEKDIAGYKQSGGLFVPERLSVPTILHYLRTLPRCFCWKEHGGAYGTAGIPDIICCYRGRFVAFEVKQPGGRPTALQAATIAKIQAADGVAHVVTSASEVRHILHELED
jgi:hypothetical protein